MDDPKSPENRSTVEDPHSVVKIAQTVPTDGHNL